MLSLPRSWPVMMPAWNSEDTLEAAAMSILDQTWQNLELLIVDDASHDDTWAVMEILARRDERVRITRNKVNVGPYVSKNVALGHARGDWITGHGRTCDRPICSSCSTSPAGR